jgi:hypothetical protein
MVRLDFGVINDHDIDPTTGAGRPTVVLVPDDGELPSAPESVLAPFGELSAAPTRLELGGVPAVRITAAWGPYVRHECYLLWVGHRGEWVALFERRIWDLDSWAGEGSFSGPYRVEEALTRWLAEAYGLDPSGRGPSSAARLPPADLAREGGRPS